MDEPDLVHVISDSPKGTAQENQEKNVVKPLGIMIRAVVVFPSSLSNLWGNRTKS